MHFTFKLSAPSPHGNYPHDYRHNSHTENNQLPDTKVIGKQRKTFFPGFKILCIKRSYTLNQHITVAHTDCQPDNAYNNPRKYTPSYKIYDRKCNKDQKRVI